MGVLEVDLSFLDEMFGQNVAPDGVSAQQISDHTGLCRDAVNKRIRRAIQQGLMEFAGLREDTTMDGRRCRIPVYRKVSA